MDGIIINFYNDGMLEMAENQLISFKKVGITKYISYTTGEYSYNYLKEKGYNVELYNIDKIQKELSWGCKDFIDMEKLRIKLIKDLLKKYNCVFYLDVDIVVLKNIELLLNFNTDNELIIQNDINMPCLGCMLLFNTNNVVNMLDDFFKIECKNSIQCYFLNYILKYKIKYTYLPLESFPNGLIFFGESNIINNSTNKMLLYKTESIRLKTKENFQNNNLYLIHANYMTGSDNKIKAFKDFNLWYLN